MQKDQRVSAVQPLIPNARLSEARRLNEERALCYVASSGSFFTSNEPESGRLFKTTRERFP